MSKSIVATILSFLAFSLLLYTSLSYNFRTIYLINPVDNYRPSFFGTTISGLWALIFFAVPGILGFLISILYDTLYCEKQGKVLVMISHFLLGLWITGYTIWYWFDPLHSDRDLTLTTVLYIVGGILFIISGAVQIIPARSKKNSG